jgi:hypothetical protein
VNVRLTQLDGALPNLALMKLAAWHKERGHQVHVTRRIEPDLFEPQNYDRVYGSVLFDFSAERLARFRRAWPNAIIGGTGSGSEIKVEQLLGRDDFDRHDYAGYPEFDASIGYTQRGCRLKCKFCRVPGMEGAPRAVATIDRIWRGEPWPKKLLLLDNDFFGQPVAAWTSCIVEMVRGGFRVCLAQGINVRLIDDEAADALSMIEYRDTKFRERRLYTAWDNLKDEAVFFRGVDRLERAGIPSKHLMAYMLIGFDRTEDWPRIWHRFLAMVDRGIEPYPMVYDRSRADLLCFQRWALTGLYRAVPWDEYRRETKTAESVAAWRATMAQRARAA